MQSFAKNYGKSIKKYPSLFDMDAQIQQEKLSEQLNNAADFINESQEINNTGGPPSGTMSSSGTGNMG